MSPKAVRRAQLKAPKRGPRYGGPQNGLTAPKKFQYLNYDPTDGSNGEGLPGSGRLEGDIRRWKRRKREERERERRRKEQDDWGGGGPHPA